MCKISSIQQAILFTQATYINSNLFNIGGYSKIEGNLNLFKLIEFVKQVLSEADTFEIGALGLTDIGVDKKEEFVNYDVQCIDFSLEGDPQTLSEEWMAKDMEKPLDLSVSFARLVFFKCSETFHIWYMKVHHLFFDGYSIMLLFNQVSELYNTKKVVFTKNAKIRNKYRDFVDDEYRYMQSPQFTSDKTYWLKKLNGIDKTIAFNSCRKTASSSSLKTCRKEVKFPREIINRIGSHFLEDNSSIAQYFLTVLLVLNNYYNNDDIVIGVPIANRRKQNFKKTLGPCVNVIPFYLEINKDWSFYELFLSVRTELRRCYRHSQIPLSEILDGVRTNGNFGNLTFSFQNHAYEQNIGDCHSVISYLHTTQQQEDLVFHVLEYNNLAELILVLDFNEELFSERLIIELLDKYKQLVEFFYQHPSTIITKLDFIVFSMDHLANSYGSETSYGMISPKNILDLFKIQVTLKGDSIALQSNKNNISYQMLNQLANQQADFLLRKKDAKSGQPIGIKIQRNEWMVISILTCLKLACYYIPLDPTYPAERIEYMVEDSGCNLIIDSKLIDEFTSEIDNFSKEDIELPTNKNMPAYVIYTSGSTGKPKGVIVEYGNLSYFLNWCLLEFQYSQFDTVIAVTSLSFDLSVFEIFFPLTAGKKILLIENAISIGTNLEKGKRILLNTVPSVLEALIKSEIDLTSLSVLNLAGEIIPFSLLHFINTDRIELRNLYGPTEDTVYSTVCRIHSDKDVKMIGRPINGKKVYILNKSRCILPDEVSGEIFISGHGLARGYINQTSATAHAFIPAPWNSQDRIYRTGDIGKRLSDGNLEFLGRIDTQIKRHGFRIELSEIESALNKFEGIASAVVAFHEINGNERDLVAYIIERSALVDSEIREFLSRKLPSYMVPVYYVKLKNFPKNGNGKVDRNALPKFFDFKKIQENYLSARNPTEECLVAIWQRILALDVISVKHNFFNLGGHSLKVIRLVNEISKCFQVDLSFIDIFTSPVLEDQARLIMESEKNTASLPETAPFSESYTLSSYQRGIWFLSQDEQANKAYNMSAVYELEGILNVEALTHSFRCLIQRHEILRTTFRENNEGEINQFIQETVPQTFFNLKIISTSDLSKSRIQNTMRTEVEQPLDLSKAPLFKVTLLKIEDQKWIFIFVIHHIICDLWSLKNMIDELSTYYNHYAHLNEDKLPPILFQYKDFAYYQKKSLSTKKMFEHQQYWCLQLKDIDGNCTMPADKLKPKYKTYNGSIIKKQFGINFTEKLEQLCSHSKVTHFTAIFTCLSIFFYKFLGKNDIVVGSPISTRGKKTLEGQLGLYVNMIVLRLQMTKLDSFASLLEKSKEVLLEAHNHQDYPFDELVRSACIENERRTGSIFDMALSFTDRDSKINPNMIFKNITIRKVEGFDRTSKYDLLFDFTEEESGLELSLQYNSDLYYEDSIINLVLHFQKLVKSVFQQPLAPIDTLDILIATEKDNLLNGLNPSIASYPNNKTIIDLFEEQVDKSPDRIAVVFQDICLSYHTLNELVNRLAHQLRTCHEILPDERIGISLQRSEWLVISILAVLKSGAAYVPVDPNYPEQRKDFIRNDSDLLVCIDELAIARFKGNLYFFESLNPTRKNSPCDLAYIIYTSGSTGQPKGVQIEHRNLVQLFKSDCKLFDFSSNDVWILFHSYAFDFSVWEIFGSLLTGSKLIIVPDLITKQATDLLALTRKENVTVLNQTPSSFYNLLKFRAFENPQLRYLIFGGESLNPRKLKEWKVRYPSTKIFNLYGITETSVIVTFKEINDIDIDSDVNNIGKPLPTARCYILDQNKNLLPTGCFGELYIGGAGVGRGYINRPSLTAERFITNPFQLHERLYKSGDMVRLLENGDIEYSNRIDNQVKIRGYRIELREIEKALCNYNNIETANALIQGEGESAEIVAFFVSKVTLNLNDIRVFLKSILPQYMVPSRFCQLPHIPMTPNGKIDKEYIFTFMKTNNQKWAKNSYQTSDEERRLMNIISKLTGKMLGEINVKDNFFDLGINSLQLVNISQQINSEFGTNLKIANVFEYPSVEMLARHISSRGVTIESTLPSKFDIAGAIDEIIDLMDQ